MKLKIEAIYSSERPDIWPLYDAEPETKTITCSSEGVKGFNRVQRNNLCVAVFNVAVSSQEARMG
jgi:hypothetical protein